MTAPKKRHSKAPKLDGHPEPTMEQAWSILRRAREEVGGEKRRPRLRRAARKVWLAASKAAEAVGGPISDNLQVIRVFERAWGTEGRALAEDINIALLYCCFYGNACACDGPFIRRYALHLAKLLRTPQRDRETARKVAHGIEGTVPKTTATSPSGKVRRCARRVGFETRS